MHAVGSKPAFIDSELSELYGLIKHQIDDERKYVISYLGIPGLEISKYLGLPTPVAVYLGPKIGCMLTHQTLYESLKTAEEWRQVAKDTVSC